MNVHKRNFLAIGVALVSALWVFNTYAQTERQAALNRIMKLFAGTWVGEEKSPDGRKIISKLTFEWTLGKKFIKVTNTVTSKGRTRLFAEATYGWHPVLQKVLFWSFDQEGSINEGSVTLVQKSLDHEWRSFGGGGRIRDLKSRFTLEDGNTATFTVLEPQESGWTVTSRIKYKRQN